MFLRNLVAKSGMVLSMGLVGMSMAAQFTVFMVPSDMGSLGYGYGGGGIVKTEKVKPGEVLQFPLRFQVDPYNGEYIAPNTVVEVRSRCEGGIGGATCLDAINVSAGGAATYGYTFTNLVPRFYFHTWEVVAPQEPGAYYTELKGEVSTESGITKNNGLIINFVVEDECSPVDPELTLSVASECIIFGNGAINNLTATLTTEDGEAIAGETVDFKVGDVLIGSMETDADGIAAYPYNPQSLPVGDHFVVASYEGSECALNAASASALISVKYLFLGFQKPIDAAGLSVFKGACIPVKIKIADANGQSIPDAAPALFFTKETSQPTGINEEPESISNADEGNVMRYDAASDQYIFNWGIRDIDNGTYTVKVYLGEGSCTSEHLVTVSLNKKK